ncbi:subtilase-type protease inhibitor [Nocardiopsis sp. EMB25]|uniref:SSI family serine proteinase inhibitor n=1 Tax=Nocardiopsis sp. EMB25 TaxID=2835867 RepID=UPI00228395C3|nr:SSI family serine proteinase inhibitor [Nocardiopsis sp. EMB25]MCY9787382.1 subtilase-type protease inhibitor [Nocardiopsis sp. EMB25]
MKLVGTILSGVAASALALSTAAPAQAVEDKTQHYRLSIEEKHTGDKKHVHLFCDPPGGTHPKPEEACDLIYAFGSIKKIDVSDSACPLVWDPVVARSSGSEHYKKTFPNMCVLLDVKGAVFDFWKYGDREDSDGRSAHEAGHPSYDGWLHGHHGRADRDDHHHYW